MRSTNDNPIDPLGSIGSPIRESKPAAPDPVKSFESQADRPLIGDHSKAVQSIADTLRRKVEDERCDFPSFEDEYTKRLLSAI